MFSLLSSLISNTFTFTLAYWAMTFFLQKKKYSWWICGVLILGSSILLTCINTLENAVLNSLSAFLLWLTFSIICFTGKISIRVVVAILLLAMEICCEFVVLYFSFLTSGSTIKETLESTLTQNIYSLISLMLFSIVVLLIRYVLNTRNKNTKKSKYSPNIAILLFPFSCILFLYYILFNTQFLESLGRDTSFEIIIVLVFVLLNVVYFVLDIRFYESQTKKAEIIEMEYQTALNERIIEQQTENIHALESAAHDYTKTLSTLKSIALETMNADAELLKYLNQSIDEIKSLAFIHRFDSIALTSIINDFATQCSQKGIRSDVCVQYSKIDFMSFPDICTLFKNLLDNAIYGASECSSSSEKYCSISISLKHRMLMIHIGNSHCGKINYVDGNYITTKLGQSGPHGIGIRNVKRVVEKYGGNYYFEHNDTEFHVVVNIPIV